MEAAASDIEHELAMSDLFREIDADASGAVSAEELLAALEARGQYASADGSFSA